MSLRTAPEFRGRGGERHTDARLAFNTLADVDHTAFQFCLRSHVGEEQSLASYHYGFKCEQAAFIIRVERFGFLVERLLIDIGAIDEQRRVVRVAQTAAAFGVFRAAARRSRGS